MGGNNVPDDWDCFYKRCSFCGERYHASEGGCSCGLDEIEYWGEIPHADELDEKLGEAEDYFAELERKRETGRP